MAEFPIQLLVPSDLGRYSTIRLFSPFVAGFNQPLQYTTNPSKFGIAEIYSRSSQSQCTLRTKHKRKDLPTYKVRPEHYLVYLPRVVAVEGGLHPQGMEEAAEVVPHRAVGGLQVEVVLPTAEGAVVPRTTRGLVFRVEHQCCFSRSVQQCNLREWYHRIS